MYLVDLEKKTDVAPNLTRLVSDISAACEHLYEEMNQSESLWIFAPSEDFSSEYWPVAMAVADGIRERSPFTLKNVISRHTDPTSFRNFANTYEEILFLVKDKSEYYFNKDPIRVDHAYEGNEWGERAKGQSAYHDHQVRRYNPDGKDPGNVWLAEDRTETADATVDRTESLPRPEAVMRCVRAGSREKETVHVAGFDGSIVELIEEERECRHLSLDELVKEQR
ncbi:DNA methyltransferase [Natrinema sp. 1APR25-10V2]|uniref:DNA methyltransferase n=1 Tax=Natrinema sp. 1APR25-10V2 TaxID=2951081 RepID=UPI002874D2C2|nr:DNA methyltransferase [Natrinema sp. 1APR25-10V2]MDS0474586.1 site-specific DNA-methyltransferase [Natrinema sp. 1APR25-10V2]